MRAALYIASGLLLTGAVPLAYLGGRPTPPVARVVTAVTITPARHDFGAVSRDEVVTARFVVQNTHPVPVDIGPITKGCSCSEAEVTPGTIPAGGTAELSVTWRLHGKRGRSAEAVSVPYTGAGGVNGFQVVQVVAVVHGVIDPDKDSLELSTANRVGEVGFTSPVGRAFKLLGTSTNHPSLKAEVLPGGRRVRVTFDPAVGGWESGQLFVAVVTDQPDEREVRVWVRARR